MGASFKQESHGEKKKRILSAVWFPEGGRSTREGRHVANISVHVFAFGQLLMGTVLGTGGRKWDRKAFTPLKGFSRS